MRRVNWNTFLFLFETEDQESQIKNSTIIYYSQEWKHVFSQLLLLKTFKYKDFLFTCSVISTKLTQRRTKHSSSSKYLQMIETFVEKTPEVYFRLELHVALPPQSVGVCARNDVERVHVPIHAHGYAFLKKYIINLLNRQTSSQY